jgi:hypothetical protein
MADPKQKDNGAARQAPGGADGSPAKAPEAGSEVEALRGRV